MVGVECLATSPNTFSTLEHQRLRTAALCVSLKQRFAELHARDFPDDGAAKSLWLLADLLSILQKRVEVIPDEKILVMASDIVIGLGAALEFFDNASTDQTPRGLVVLLQSLYGRLSRPSNLLAWPQSDYNFTIRPLVKVLKIMFGNLGPDTDIDAVFQAYTGPHELVSFPRIERDNVRMYAVFGHEMGHEVADTFLNQELTTAQYKAEETDVRSKVVAAMGGDPSLPDLQKRLEHVFRLRKRALEELISDTVGIYLFGPSALFAGHEIHAGTHADRIPSNSNDGYPPGRMRLRVSLGLCRVEGQLDALADFVADPRTGTAFAAGKLLVDHIDTITSSDADTQAIATDSFVSIAYEWVNSTLPKAQAFAKTSIGTALYAEGTQRAECSKLVERLLDGLPPNEVGSSLDPVQVDARSAILAAWLISLQSSQTPGKNSNEEIIRLNEKTLRGIEYIELQREYLVRFPRTAP